MDRLRSFHNSIFGAALFTSILEFKTTRNKWTKRSMHHYGTHSKEVLEKKSVKIYKKTSHYSRITGSRTIRISCILSTIKTKKEEVTIIHKNSSQTVEGSRKSIRTRTVAHRIHETYSN